MSSSRLVLGLVALLALGGCHTGTLPDPNNPKDVGAISPDAIRRNLSAVTGALTERLSKGELTDSEYRQLVSKAANELLESVDPNTVNPSQAWEYGEVLRDGKRWSQAESFLRVAVKYAVATKNEDRRINDTLRLAQAIAEQGRVDEAIKTARMAFNASPVQSAPILLAVYMELVPAVHNPKGHELELAKLIEDAIGIQMKTVVDKGTRAGLDFITARPHHVANAWRLASRFFESAGHHKEAVSALEKSAGAAGKIYRRVSL